MTTRTNTDPVPTATDPADPGTPTAGLALRGFATVTFFADDLLAASRWYAELLGVEPYFEVLGPDGRPGYREFRIGDYQDELGLIDRRYQPGARPAAPGGALVYWHVDDLPAALDRLLAMGATEHEPYTERSEGFATASVVDPFGNVLGVMYNPHYLEILESARPACRPVPADPDRPDARPAGGAQSSTCADAPPVRSFPA